MRKFLALCLAAGTLVALALPGVAGAGAETVRVRIVAAGADRAELQSRHGVRHDFGALGFTTDVPASALPALASRPGVRVEQVPYAQPIALAEGAAAGRAPQRSTAVPTARVPWGIHVVYDGTLGTGEPTGGEGIRVAVLDTGIYTGHPDFTGKSFFACLDYTGRGSAPKQGCTDRNGHGTHVAGTIAANGGTGTGIFGVAPAAQLGAYKVCGPSGCAYDDIAAAIDRATADGARIISMSLGGSAGNDLLLAAIRRAVSAGVLVVAAAGNSGPDDDTIAYPAAYPEVVAVASVYQETAGTDYSAANLIVNSWSSRGMAGSSGADGIQEREVEVAAPGYLVESTWKDGGYQTLSGTSMATPHISGLAAKMWNAWGGTADAVRKALQDTARLHDVTRSNQGNGVIQSGRDGYDNAAGYGSARIR